MNKFLLLILVVILHVGCTSKSKVEQEITEIPVDFELVRFDKIFGNATINDLPDLKSKYTLFFPERFDDSVWEQRMVDTLQLSLNEEVLKVSPSEENLEEGLHSLFQHIKYYFENFDVPKVYTTTSDVDYRNKVIVADSLLIIELDTYLGSEHYFYTDISRFITKTMKSDMVTSDVATAYSRNYIEVPRQRTLLSKMVYFGKELYLKDIWLPNVSDANKIGYTENELLWAQENEAYIWSFFIEKELLFSSDVKLPGRFINPAPFSKFNLELDNESPGMVGRYIGWKIVQSYMEKNDVSPSQLMTIPAEELFKNSKYKPKK
ncbi:MAG: gliding motility lipoprotein GldB [Flavobacteriaceae bacterium]|nr:gliding motility lipoprotein GldB [Flavobacteriaceae bacterium]